MAVALGLGSGLFADGSAATVGTSCGGVASVERAVSALVAAERAAAAIALCRGEMPSSVIGFGFAASPSPPFTPKSTRIIAAAPPSAAAITTSFRFRAFTGGVTIEGSASISAALEDMDADVEDAVMGEVVDRGLGSTLESTLRFARADSEPRADPDGGVEAGGGTGAEIGADEASADDKVSIGAPNDRGGAGGGFESDAPGWLGISGRLIRTDVSALLISESSSSRSCGFPVASPSATGEVVAELGGAEAIADCGGGGGSGAWTGGGAGVGIGATWFFGSCWPGAVGASDTDGIAERFTGSVGCSA